MLVRMPIVGLERDGGELGCQSPTQMKIRVVAGAAEIGGQRRDEGDLVLAATNQASQLGLAELARSGLS